MDAARSVLASDANIRVGELIAQREPTVADRCPGEHRRCLRAAPRTCPALPAARGGAGCSEAVHWTHGMGLVDKFVFEDRGARGCSDSDYEFAITTCCERVGVVDEELGDFYWSSDTPSRSITILEGSNCPFCDASTWKYRHIEDLVHVPEHWRWACEGRPRPGRRIVRSLAEHVAELLEFCRRVASPIPAFDAVLFLDKTDPRSRDEEAPIAEPGTLQAAADFRPIFDRLLVSGYSSLSLSAYGIFRGNMIVVVEPSAEQGAVPPGLTTVNYSGPARRRDGTPNWELAR